MKRLKESKKELDKRVEKVGEVAFAMEPVVLSSRIDVIAGGVPSLEHVDPDTGEVLPVDASEPKRSNQTKPIVGDFSLETFILD